jgi:hypothetical protein
MTDHHLRDQGRDAAAPAGILDPQGRLNDVD